MTHRSRNWWRQAFWSFVILTTAWTSMQVFSGCSTIAAAVRIVDATENTCIDALVLDPSLYKYEHSWVVEAARRYDDCVVVLVHGDCIDDQWYATMPDACLPMENLVRGVQESHPGRRIVLVSCNPCGADLDVDGVTYSPDEVWLVPDRGLHPRFVFDPDTIGNIYEFVEE